MQTYVPEARPFLRGRLHRLCQFLIAIFGLLHVVFSSGDGVTRAALTIFYLTNLSLYFVSPVYHLNYWQTQRLHDRVLQIDQVIGGCYTGLALTSFRGMEHGDTQ